MKSLSNLLVLATVAGFLFAPGCSDSQFPVKPAKGKVVVNGQPVTSGTVTFTPLGASDKLETGKPASGTVGADGTFVLSTFDRFDGAIVGKHSVQYSGAEDEEAEAEEVDEGAVSEEASAASKPAGNRPTVQAVQKGEIILEVTAAGPNDFTIELQPAGK